MCMCARVSAHVCVISRSSIIFKIEAKLINPLTLYIHEITLIFFSCGTIFLFISLQVMWHDRKRSIHALNGSRRSSLSEGYEVQSNGVMIHFKMI